MWVLGVNSVLVERPPPGSCHQGHRCPRPQCEYLLPAVAWVGGRHPSYSSGVLGSFFKTTSLLTARSWAALPCSERPTALQCPSSQPRVRAGLSTSQGPPTEPQALGRSKSWPLPRGLLLHLCFGPACSPVLWVSTSCWDRPSRTQSSLHAADPLPWPPNPSSSLSPPVRSPGLWTVEGEEREGEKLAEHGNGGPWEGGGKAGTGRAAGYKLPGADSGAEKLPSPAEQPSGLGGLPLRPFPVLQGVCPVGGQEEGPRWDPRSSQGRGLWGRAHRGHVGAQRLREGAGQCLGRRGLPAAAGGRLARAAVLRGADAAGPGWELSGHFRHLPPQANEDGDQLLHR